MNDLSLRTSRLRMSTATVPGPSPAPAMNRAPSVLVIEDNMDVADSMARFLRVAAGYEVRVAYNGEAGLKAAYADPPDVVVCDLAMPRMNGLRVADELSARVPRPLMIALTAFGVAFPEDLAMLAGFDHYLQKPADPFAIEALIRNHVQ
jgi:DNA-binding response OmpR family regulator